METAQQQRDDDLETESKNIVEAINEINSKTLENVDQAQLKSEISKVNQNIADGFNTINGRINNEIRPAIKANEDAITKEISDREQENKNIRSEFAEEDSKLQNTINSIKTELQESINIESSERKSADTVLSNRIATIEDADYQTGTEVDNRINEIVGAAPEALDTLKEIADALNNDPDFAATITTQLSKKVDKVEGKQLSTNDYTTAEKEKLAGLENYDDTELRNQLQQTETGVAENLTAIEKLKSGKQDTLISGESIKTINGETILGSGDIDFSEYVTTENANNTYATKADVTAHINNTENPHNVTKTQIGLSNVDNTSDLNKPISTATQNALAGKQDKTDSTLQTTDKTIVGAINEVNSRAELMPVVTTVPELTDDYQIPANDTNTEKIYRITIGETAYYITAADSVKWQNGIMPATSPNTTIVVSVIDNLATWGVF